MPELSDATLLWMRAMYVYGVLGVGVVGLVTLLAPKLAAHYIFAGTAEPSSATSILGSL